MGLLGQLIGFMIFSLIIVNGLTHGAVWDSIDYFATAEEKAEARADLKCLSGYLMYMPTTDVYGVDVPAPSYANVILAIMATFILIMLIEIPSRFDFSPVQSVILFVIVWVVIKVIGFYYIMTSTDNCMVWATESGEKVSGIYLAGGGAAGLYAVIRLYMFKK